MVSKRVFDLTHSDKTLTSVLAANPKESPGELGKRLYEEYHHGVHNPSATGGILSTVKSMLTSGSTAEEAKAATAEDEPSKEDLDRAAECGRFGTRPSDLFLKVRRVAYLYATPRQYIGTAHDACVRCPRLFPWARMLFFLSLSLLHV